MIDSIKNLLPSECRVLRGGQELRVPTHTLVPGDICRLTPGVKVPADLVLFSCAGLKVDVSCVTGESEPIEAAVTRKSDSPVEAHNLIFTSSLVQAGEAWGIVVKTGPSTLVGCIAAGAHQTGPPRETLKDLEVRRIIQFVVAISLATGCAFLAIGLGRGLGVAFAITNAFILTLVANVPEGLPGERAPRMCTAPRRHTLYSSLSLFPPPPSCSHHHPSAGHQRQAVRQQAPRVCQGHQHGAHSGRRDAAVH